jgi:hypothetical protein
MDKTGASFEVTKAEVIALLGLTTGFIDELSKRIEANMSAPFADHPATAT